MNSAGNKRSLHFGWLLLFEFECSEVHSAITLAIPMLEAKAAGKWGFIYVV